LNRIFHLCFPDRPAIAASPPVSSLLRHARPNFPELILSLMRHLRIETHDVVQDRKHLLPIHCF
jgi:hypothetical protein